MQLAPDLYLTYCTNIHPANGWEAVRRELARYGPALKAALAPDEPFGIGLRLSGEESRTLLEEDHLARFQADLDEQGLVIFTMNGFPYGPFHSEPVKDLVHAPDWRDPERVQYTIRLAEILATLLPDGLDGSISTSPLSYKPWFKAGVDRDSWTQLVGHLVEVVVALVRLREETGRVVHIDIEPEPDGLLETSAELVGFFEDRLLPEGSVLLADQLGLSRAEAVTCLLEHLQVCWDTCHVAVAYEDPADVLARYRAAGIQVGKVQISSALSVSLPDNPEGRRKTAEALQPFAESTYLHQVVQRNRNGSLHQYPDLDVALPSIQDREAETWRIHFHVPVFLKGYGAFDSTQTGILDTFELLRQESFTPYLEIETYTWDVLPPALKQPLDASILREFRWVLGTLKK